MAQLYRFADPMAAQAAAPKAALSGRGYYLTDSEAREYFAPAAGSSRLSQRGMRRATRSLPHCSISTRCANSGLLRDSRPDALAPLLIVDGSTAAFGVPA